jgi:DNA-binding NarL/FixJ family response regulator
MDRASVLVATESRLFNDALRETLDDYAEIDVVGEADDTTSTLASCFRLEPSLALISAGLPGPGGALGVCAQIMDTPELQTLTLVLSEVEDEEHMFAALEAGALGYVTSRSGVAQLLEDLRGVLRGEARVPAQMLGAVLRSLVSRQRRGSELLDRYADLSRRERQVLGLLARGLDHVQIAEALVISAETARTHIQRVLTKLGVHSRLEAATLAIEQGWVSGGVRSDR